MQHSACAQHPRPTHFGALQSARASQWPGACLLGRQVGDAKRSGRGNESRRAHSLTSGPISDKHRPEKRQPPTCCPLPRILAPRRCPRHRPTGRRLSSHSVRCESAGPRLLVLRTDGRPSAWVSNPSARLSQLSHASHGMPIGIFARCTITTAVQNTTPPACGPPALFQSRLC